MLNDFEIRSASGIEATDKGTLIGYASVFDSLSEDLGGFHEIVKKGAFDRTLKEFPDIMALYEHDVKMPLARTKNGTLTITPDSHGLRVEITPTETTYSRDIVSLVRAGTVSGMSFRFKPFPGGNHFENRGGKPLHVLSSVQLKEITITSDPAYRATEISARTLDKARAEAARMTYDIDNAMRRLRLASL